MTLYDKEALFSAYLDNSLDSEQEKQFNALCDSDAEFAQAVENSARLNSASSSFVAPALPQWDKEQTFFKKDEPLRCRLSLACQRAPWPCRRVRC